MDSVSLHNTPASSAEKSLAAASPATATPPLKNHRFLCKGPLTATNRPLRKPWPDVYTPNFPADIYTPKSWSEQNEPKPPVEDEAMSVAETVKDEGRKKHDAEVYERRMRRQMKTVRNKFGTKAAKCFMRYCNSGSLAVRTAKILKF